MDTKTEWIYCSICGNKSRTVEDLLNEIENETLYEAFATGAIYARLEHLRKKLKKIL